jgi:hypothetical protein
LRRLIIARHGAICALPASDIVARHARHFRARSEDVALYRDVLLGVEP